MSKGPYQSELAKVSVPIFNKDRGLRFELARMRLYMTQAKIASKLSTPDHKITQQAVHSLEKGKTALAHFTVEQLHDALGIVGFEYVLFNKHAGSYIEGVVRGNYWKVMLEAKKDQKKRGNPFRSEMQRLQKQSKLE